MIFSRINTGIAPLPVICLDDRRPLKNRRIRRSSIFGKQTVEDRLRGKLTPKQQREWL